MEVGTNILSINGKNYSNTIEWIQRKLIVELHQSDRIDIIYKTKELCKSYEIDLKTTKFSTCCFSC